MMELTQEQYQEIKPSLPVQRGYVKLSNRLKGIDCPLAGGPMIMDPADEGEYDSTAGFRLDLLSGCSCQIKSPESLGV